MRETVVKLIVGDQFKKMIGEPKNLLGRHNPQVRHISALKIYIAYIVELDLKKD